MTKDPVCGMTVDNKSPHRSTHAGQTYVFCCTSCKTKFDNEPGRYAAPAAGEVQRGSRP
jgi:Cu+-exporting ATPase